ncbi:MAG: hypothetical protein CME65_00010 [Halobacteriovoraceae bacterium]|nr:hypothetical protein [Halobacteriovoraceae bacterium]|tara:strand:- start:8896 stop:9135 length:240 start_codon:yes stop_codon:yes gene_type:complete
MNMALLKRLFISYFKYVAVSLLFFAVLFLLIFIYLYIFKGYDKAILSISTYYLTYVKMSFLFSIVMVVIEEKNRKKDSL